MRSVSGSRAPQMQNASKGGEKGWGAENLTAGFPSRAIAMGSIPFLCFVAADRDLTVRLVRVYIPPLPPLFAVTFLAVCSCAVGGHAGNLSVPANDPHRLRREGGAHDKGKDSQRDHPPARVSTFPGTCHDPVLSVSDLTMHRKSCRIMLFRLGDPGRLLLRSPWSIC